MKRCRELGKAVERAKMGAEGEVENRNAEGLGTVEMGLKK